MAKTSIHFHLPLVLLYFTLLNASSQSHPDLKTLMSFKSGSDRSNKLSTWNSTTNPCSFSGVSCVNNRVFRLVLEDLDLHGSFEPLVSLTQLRVLSLKNNRFSGPIPNLSKLTSLKLLFLSVNDFSGNFPATISSLPQLYRLDLSYNNFSGEIPAEVNRLINLLTLRLEENTFSGLIPVMNLPNLQDFNVSSNRLSGEVPKSLSAFPVSAFAQNQGLCGSPMESCKTLVSDPTRPGSAGAVASPLMPATKPTTVVSSSPSSMPITTAPKNSANTGHSETPKLGTVAIIAISLGDVLVLVILSLLIYCCFWRKYVAKEQEKKGSSKLIEREKIVYSSSPYRNQSGFEQGKMVFFEGVKRFELEDLLQASAEMLGKGGFGTAYKAVLEDSIVVAVKRLKDAQVGGRREFEQHMEVLGKLRHPNVVSLKAYYLAREEKLLVHDYMPNGSLFWLLHGNRGPGRTPLDWTTRLKIVAGTAHGLAYIHNYCKSFRLAHGNIKSTNILLDKFGNARVCDFGLFAFAACPTTATAPRSNGYHAPELLDNRNFTQKSDVYSFGVLLLEVLTGKCPSVLDGSCYGGVLDLPRWVQSVVREEWTAEVFDLELMRYKDIEEEMVSLLQIAMACSATSPDQRPSMNHVVKMIEELRGVEVSPSHETSDYVSDSPAVSEDTYRASQ